MRLVAGRDPIAMHMRVYVGPNFEETFFVKWVDDVTNEYAYYNSLRDYSLRVKKASRIKINLDAKCVFILN